MSRRRRLVENSAVCIDFAEGGSVSLAFKGNMFDLTPDEQTLIAAITTLVKTFKNGTETDVETAKRAWPNDA